jgi:hypothetical protein
MGGTSPHEINQAAEKSENKLNQGNGFKALRSARGSAAGSRPDKEERQPSAPSQE